MKNELLFDYNLLRDWPQPDNWTIKKAQIIGFILGAVGLTWMILVFIEGYEFERSSDYLNFANHSFITVFGFLQFFFPSKFLPPFDRESKSNYIKIDNEKIVWRQGLFHKHKTVYLSEVERYEFYGAMIYLHTLDKKLVINGADVRGKAKKNELFTLIKELARRES